MAAELVGLCVGSRRSRMERLATALDGARKGALWALRALTEGLEELQRLEFRPLGDEGSSEGSPFQAIFPCQYRVFKDA